MLVTTLYRMAGEPQVEEKSTFTDVAENRYYADAVAWAQANGMAKGVTDTAFCPRSLCHTGSRPPPSCTGLSPNT